MRICRESSLIWSKQIVYGGRILRSKGKAKESFYHLSTYNMSRERRGENFCNGLKKLTERLNIGK
jgi:hypothetical protein